MQTVLLIVHMLASAALIGLVLLQQGKGADMGAAFGSGASATVFGSRGSASFLTRTTAILAAVFFITSISLAYFSSRRAVPKTIIEMPAEAPASAPLPQQAPPDVPSIPPAQK